MEKRQTSNSRNYSSYTNRSRTFGNSGEVIKSPSFTGNSITEYQEYLEAADKSSMDDLVGLIIGIEEVPENAFESLILPAPWMDPPKTVGDLSMNLIIIWILDAEELSDGGLKVAALLGNLAKLTISYSMIVHICRLLMEGKESALYLFFQLTKVDTFCQEVIDQHQQDILDCLEYSAGQATKNEVKILSLCCMFHLATNSPELTEWLLNKYEVKDKIVDLFAEEKDGKNINIDIDIDVPVVIEEINEDSFERDKGSFTEEYKQILKKSIASSFQGSLEILSSIPGESKQSGVIIMSQERIEREEQNKLIEEINKTTENRGREHAEINIISYETDKNPSNFSIILNY